MLCLRCHHDSSAERLRTLANTTQVSIGLVDYKGDVGRVVVHFPDNVTMAELQNWISMAGVGLDTLSGAKVTSATVTLPLPLGFTPKADPLANHDLEKGANMAYDAQNTPYRHTIRVPAIADAALVGDVVDENHGGADMWNNLIVSGDGIIQPSDRYGNDLTSFMGGVVTFRKS